MKKGFALFLLIAFLSVENFSVTAQKNASNEKELSIDEKIKALEAKTNQNQAAQEANIQDNKQLDLESSESSDNPVGTKNENEEKKADFHQIIKQKFMEGGPEFMGIVLLCLILGLALAIERIIYLNMATTNTSKLLNNVEGALNAGGVDAA